MNPSTLPTDLSTLDDHRRCARERLALPADDDYELAHHLTSRYLDRCRANGTSGATPELLTGLGRLFSAVAERRQLRSDDPALLALAEILLHTDVEADAVRRELAAV